jgi:8-oxo-dGTP pyrophosphatase MutT (NUDIX family)
METVPDNLSDFHEGITLVKNCFDLPLPGEPAQYKMAPVQRKSNNDYLDIFPDHRKSSVLLLLYPGNDNHLSTILIERPGNSGIHSDQIALPGGKLEPFDLSPSHAALRETYEEIGVPEKDIIILGELSSLFIPASNFLVYPFVGLVYYKPDFVMNQMEVKTMIPVRIAELLTMPVNEKAFQTSYGLLNAPFYLLRSYTIWGATAMILSEFITMISNFREKKPDNKY